MATTVISDLPQDALVSILRAVLDAADYVPAGNHPALIHKILRKLNRAWRDAADIAYIEHRGKLIYLDLNDLQDPATARLRAFLASMVHALDIRCPDSLDGCPAPITARALSSLFASADLRRVLKRVELYGMTCANQVAAAVPAVVVCPHLTALELSWFEREHDHGFPRVVLAPLTRLGLKHLAMQAKEDLPLFRVTLPALPDISSLTSLELGGEDGAFAVVASDASLGRLRRLSLSNNVVSAVHNEWASNDPFRQRADMEAGMWRPHLLTSLQNLSITMVCGPEDDAWAPRVYAGPVPAAAVWEPLAPTVTELKLYCEGSIFHDADMETGMYAGLGVLTGLRALDVTGRYEDRCPADLQQAHLPRLTKLAAREYVGPPIDLARFLRLVHVEIESTQPEPLAVSSVAALRRLASLRVWAGRRDGQPLGEHEFRPRLNLAQLFGGGRPLAALTGLSFYRVSLSWDAAAAAGAPTASEFAARARALLPSLRSVEIKEELEMDDGVREFVVPAVLALGRG